MCERARRSRDASSRYSIDTLFPGLSNNSAHARNTPEETCVADQEEPVVAPPPQVASMIEENNTNNGVASAEIGVGTDGGRREEGGAILPTSEISPSPSMLAPANATAAAITTESAPGTSSGGRKRNQNNSGGNSGGYNGNNHRGRHSKRVNEGSDDRLAKETKSSRSTTTTASPTLSSGTGGKAAMKDESVDNNGVCLSKPTSVGSKAASSSANGNASSGRASNSRSASNNNGNGTTGRKRAGSPLKPTTIQPKQMSLLSTSKMSRKTMFEAFQPWVLRTYGDSAKTKTITKKKYCRIVKTLRGEEINNAENSKFRFWVKAKGFHIGPPTGHPHVKDDLFPFANNNNNGDDGGFGCYMDPELYVPTTVKDGSTIEKSVYKRVAVVEYFFDIIYTVHVETEAKNGKHAGQKRTYRAITEKYAFLPREAVTKFLLQCMECQKRGSPGGGGSGGGANHGGGVVGGDTSNGKVVAVDSSTPSPDSSGTTILTSQHPHHHHPHYPHDIGSSATPLSTSPLSSSAITGGVAAVAATAVTITTTGTPETSPLALAVAATSSSSSSSSSCSSANNTRAWRNANSRNSNATTTSISECHYNNNNGKSSPPPLPFDINFSLPFTTTYLRQQEQQQKQQQQQMRLRNGFKQDQDDDEDTHMSDANSEEDHEHPRVKGGRSKNNNDNKVGDASAGGTPSSDLSTGTSDWLGFHPLGLKKEPPPNGSNNNIYSNGKSDFREQSSPLSLNERSGANHEMVQDETSSNGNKEDEDDDDDDSEDKMDTQQYDPERLKAFNMFVRLFVDENLDRMVPISKQPKEKIQAIIDSCTRQFPEFAERARKRIRTYLKSCRRNKRSRDSSGWESSRPTPAHLTSVQAEQILAQACENESQNAKRMRMGLEPVSQPLPMPLQNESRNSKENGIQNSNSAGDLTPEKSSKSSPPAPPAAHSLSSATATIGSAAAISTSVSSSSPGLPSDGMNNQNLNLSLNGGASSVTSSVDNILGQHPSAAANSANKSMERSPLVDYSRTLNGSGVPNMSMYRPNFGQPFPRTAPFPSLFPPASAAAVAAAAAAAAVGGTSSFPHNVSPLPVANGDAGPTDLSMKSKPLLTHKLNATELATVRQLITGYRESAAFLLRSADELEQLLIQQQ